MGSSGSAGVYGGPQGVRGGSAGVRGGLWGSTGSMEGPWGSAEGPWGSMEGPWGSVGGPQGSAGSMGVRGGQTWEGKGGKLQRGDTPSVSQTFTFSHTKKLIAHFPVSMTTSGALAAIATR